MRKGKVSRIETGRKGTKRRTRISFPGAHYLEKRSRGLNVELSSSRPEKETKDVCSMTDTSSLRTSLKRSSGKCDFLTNTRR